MKIYITIACLLLSYMAVNLVSCNKISLTQKHCKDLVNDPSRNDSSQIIIPNAFTPNGDGLNDVFIPLYFNISTVEFTVFNTRGKELFKTTDMTQGFIPEEIPEKNKEYLFRLQASAKS